MSCSLVKGKKDQKIEMTSKAVVPLVNPSKEGAKIDSKSYKISYGPVNDRKKTEISLKYYKDGDKEEFLQFILDYKRHAPRLGWDTPVLLFENIEALLQGAALTQWQVLDSTSTTPTRSKKLSIIGNEERT